MTSFHWTNCSVRKPRTFYRSCLSVALLPNVSRCRINFALLSVTTSAPNKTTFLYSFVSCAARFTSPWFGVQTFPRRPYFFLSLQSPRDLSLLQNFHTYSVADPVGTVCSLSGLKWPGHEADHQPPSSVEVKNELILELLAHTPSWRAKEQLLPDKAPI
jgi:hypothetical protein